jgi:peptidyl-prolyl cis-trans isomerase A (cyclophilin A)
MKLLHAATLLGAMFALSSCSSSPAPESKAPEPAKETAKAPEPPAKPPEPPPADKQEPVKVAKAEPPKSEPKKEEPKKEPGPNLLDPSTMKARAPGVFYARFNTTKGPFVIEVHRDWAPNGADHFYNLVRGGFYNDAAFFRVIPGFMAQFGMSARPEVSRIWANSNIPDDPVKQSNTRGMVTFAQTSLPNSRSTQLFINYGNNARLDQDRFAPFGRVFEGMDIVDSIYSGYGEQPEQGLIQSQGKAYLDRAFPRLDRTLTATIVPAPAGKAGEDKGPEK